MGDLSLARRYILRAATGEDWQEHGRVLSVVGKANGGSGIGIPVANTKVSRTEHERDTPSAKLGKGFADSLGVALWNSHLVTPRSIVDISRCFNRGYLVIAIGSGHGLRRMVLLQHVINPIGIGFVGAAGGLVRLIGNGRS